MDKKSIIGIVLTSLIFVGFAIYTSKQQQDYQQKLREYNAYMAQQEQTVQSTPDVVNTSAVEGEAVVSREEREQQLAVARYGATLAGLRGGEAQIVTLENDYLKVDFSSLGGQIVDVQLKEYTRYAPKDERNELVKMFDPESAKFDMSFFVKNGVNNVKVSTSEYNFEVLPVEQNDSLQRLTMRLPLGEGAYYVYEYTLYRESVPSRDYMIDFKVRLENMAPLMASQSSIAIDWSNRSYQNERGFKNENMYTTIAYRLPGESSIEELGMSEESKSDDVSSSVNWVAFKQQFFSSVFIAPKNVTYAKMEFDTAKPGSGYIKDFSAEMSVPYDAQIEGYDFSFYFGPNKYAVLKKITDENGDKIALERLIPLGWGIFGWVNRWFVIPVFDFLRQFIPSFGIIILILALLVRLIIFPLTYKSYLSTAKIRVIQPEIAALNEKYPREEDAMKKQQATMELYKKAGINPMGGCLPMLIQMPILFALYQVIWKVPAYVSSVYNIYTDLVNKLLTTSGAQAYLEQFATAARVNFEKQGFVSDTIVDILYSLTPANWADMAAQFPDLSTIINETASKAEHINSFLGINIADSPMSIIMTGWSEKDFLAIIVAVAIPLLAGLTQWLQTKMMPQADTSGMEDNAVNSSMKTMNTVMPLMSVFFCFTFSTGLGIYWVAGSVIRCIIQLIVNKQMDKVDIDTLVKENMEKYNAKREKQGLPPERISNQAKANLKNIKNPVVEDENAIRTKSEKRLADIKASTEYYNKTAKPGSIASKARMVEQYNEKTNKKK